MVYLIKWFGDGFGGEGNDRGVAIKWKINGFFEMMTSIIDFFNTFKKV